MVPVMSLWMPIILSAVIVFLTSFVIHMVLTYHRGDYKALPDEGMNAAMEVYALCDQVAADRRANPRDDIMTALVEAEIDGERLNEAELNLFFITLIVAGNETTRNLINHSMLALMERPGEAQRLRDDPSLWDTGVEEMLSAAPSHETAGEIATEGLRAIISKGLDLLTDRERDVVVRHYGLEKDTAPMTLDQIGRIFGVTKERIRQIERRALTKLKESLGAYREDFAGS